MAMNELNSNIPLKPDDRFDIERLNILLRRYCLSLTRSEWDSEDLVQDTWLRMYDRLNAAQHGNPQALLLRTAKNIWIDQLRRRKLHDRIVKEAGSEQQQARNVPETSAADVEDVFMALLGHCSPLQQTVLLMRKLFGYSVAETAKLLETTEGAVRAASYRATKWIHEAGSRDDMIESMPEDDQLRNQARALAAAYEAGDVSEMLRLLRPEGSTMDAVGSYTENGAYRSTLSTRSITEGSGMNLMMAA